MSQIDWAPEVGPVAADYNQVSPDAAYSKPQQFLSDAVDGEVAIQLSTTSRRFKSADVYGYKVVADDGPPTNNTGNIYVGFHDGTTLKLVDQVPPGSYVIVKASDFAALDLSDVWVWGDTSGDKVFVRYN